MGAGCKRLKSSPERGGGPPEAKLAEGQRGGGGSPHALRQGAGRLPSADCVDCHLPDPGGIYPFKTLRSIFSRLTQVPCTWLRSARPVFTLATGPAATLPASITHSSDE